MKRSLVLLKEFGCSKFIPKVTGKEIEKAASGIYPLQNTFVRKVKILKAPKFDLGKAFGGYAFSSSEIEILICDVLRTHQKCMSMILWISVSL